MLKVFYDGYFLGDETFGGISRMWNEIWQRLSDDKEIEIIIYAPENQNIAFRLIQSSNNIRFYKEKTFSSPRIRLFERRLNIRNLRLAYVLKKMNIPQDYIFHSTLYSAPIFKKDRKTVVTVHDLNAFKVSKPLQNYYTLCLKREISRAIMRSDEIIAVSEATKEDILYFFPRIKYKNIHVVYHGVGELREARIFPEQKYNLPERYFLFVGGRNQYKNINIIFKAIARIKSNNIKLVLVGPDTHPLLKLYENTEMRKLGISSNIIDLGLVSDQELSSLYKSALALVLPSLFEGFGFPLLEAFSYGCPVIASDITVFKELGKDYAIYFDPYNEIKLAEILGSFLENKIVIPKLKEACEYAKGFTWEKTINQLKNIYEKIS